MAGAALTSTAKSATLQATQGQGRGPRQPQSRQRSGPRRKGGGRREEAQALDKKHKTKPGAWSRLHCRNEHCCMQPGGLP
eukprot:5361323-Pyramimonas_sp.AAC.1